MIFDYQIGKLLKTYRRDVLGLKNAKEFARIAGVSETTIKNWEVKKEILDPRGRNLPKWLFFDEDIECYFKRRMQEVGLKSFIEDTPNTEDTSIPGDYIREPNRSESMSYRDTVEKNEKEWIWGDHGRYYRILYTDSGKIFQEKVYDKEGYPFWQTVGEGTSPLPRVKKGRETDK